MNNGAVILSFVFCLMGMIYKLVGYYALSFNLKRRINKVFFWMYLSLSYWSVCYFISSITDSYEYALLAQRLSSFGWVFSYPLLFHFTKLLANGDQKLSKKTLFMLYFPAIILVAIFINPFGTLQFNLVKTSYGYTSITPNTVGNMMFNIYCVVLSLLAVYNSYEYYKRMHDNKIKKLIKLFVIFEFISFLLGLTTDIVMVRILQIPLIQMSVVWFFLPTMFLFFILNKIKVINKIEKMDFDSVFDDRARENVFRTFGYMYIVFGYIALFVQFFDIVNSFILYLCCILGGTFIYFATHIIKSERLQNASITALFSTSIVVVHLMFRQDMAMTVWSFFFCYAIITTIFQKTYFNYFIATLMILCQVFYWVVYGTQTVSFTWFDYFLRIVIILIFLSVITFINREYRRKAKENLLNIEKQKVMSVISTSIIELNMHNIYEKMSELLNSVNEGFDVVRSYYVVIHPLDRVIDKMYLVENGQSTIMYDYSKTALGMNPDWVDQLKEKGEKIEIFDIKHVNELDDDLKAKFYENGITGMYALPVFVGGKFRGILGFEFEINEHNKLMHFYLDILINLITDIVKKVDNERVLFHNANFDEVTGLNNRSFFVREAGNILASSKQKGGYVIYIDIDNFKSINDTFGHTVGDSVLLKFASLLREVFGINNLITRFSGDEFEIFIPDNVKREVVEDYCLAILSSLKNGIRLIDNNFRLNINIGIAQFPDDGIDIESLTKNADIAMHESKKHGYAKYHFCSDLDKEKVTQESHYTDKLYDALQNREFYLVYQPQVGVETERTLGAEVLLRWHSDEYGSVPPYKFIPILEHIGEIIDVTEWIVEEVFRDHLNMIEQGIEPVVVSINLSPVQFLDTTFIDKLAKLLEEYKVDPSYFEFEITESVAINDSDYVADIFKSIKEMGFTIAIDDFGTGFSSLGRLQSLLIDKLKVDKSFVDGIGVDDKKEAIVDIVIQLAQKLGLKTIAEGVEYIEQVEYLRDRNCDYIQGYYYAKPMKLEDFKEFISKGNKSEL